MSGIKTNSSGNVELIANGVTALTAKDTGVVTAGAAGISGNDVVVMGQSKLVSATAQNTTSGTSIDFTGIPAWAKRITVMLNGVSTNGTSVVQLQLGTSGGVETTGYAATASSAQLSTVGTVAATTGFVTEQASVASAALVRSGAVALSLLSGNTWAVNGAVSQAPGTGSSVISGSKALSGTLDRIRLTTVGGTDTFDAGSVNIMWE